MSNYTKATNFAAKDSLSVSDPAKVIKGTEIDNEYNAIASAVSSKADTNSPGLTGTPTAPTASVGTNTTQIASCAFVLANSVPTGIITMWSGTIATIPSGWYLCDGNNSTPDLRDKFIIGAKQDETSIAKTNITGSLTQTGGSKDAIAVSHTHTATSTVTDSGHTHPPPANFTQYSGYGTTPGNSSGANNTFQGANATGSATTGITVATSIATAGSSGTNANLVPYFALAYIMKG